MVYAYLVYLLSSIALTVWVGHTLHRNGFPFVLHAFSGNELLATSINNLLLVGFYLVNFGFMSLTLKATSPILNLTQAVELLSIKLGQVLVVLGAMHFFNMHMLHKLRRREGRSLHAPAPMQSLGGTV